MKLFTFLLGRGGSTRPHSPVLQLGLTGSDLSGDISTSATGFSKFAPIVSLLEQMEKLMSKSKTHLDVMVESVTQWCEAIMVPRYHGSMKPWG